MSEKTGCAAASRQKMPAPEQEGDALGNSHEKDKKSAKLTAAGLAAIVLVVAVLCTFFVGSLKENMEKETNRYLQELSEHISSMIDYRVRVNFQTLATVSATCSSIVEESEIFPYLRNVQEKYGYLRMGIVDKNGIDHTTDNYAVDVTHISTIQQSLAGKEGISNVINSPIDGQEIIFFSVPLYVDGEIAGAVVASLSQDALRELVNVESFGGEGFSQIIDYDGNLIIQSDNKNAPQDGSNYFDLIRDGKIDSGYSLDKMKQDMQREQTGLLYFSLKDGAQKAMVYTSLDVEQWYLLSIVPTKVTGEKTALFIRMSIVINVIIFLLFIALLLLILYLQRKNRNRLERIAFVDPVTNGSNRAKFEIDAGRTIREAPPSSWVLVSLDIHQFKLINDAFGSEDGNRTLHYVHATILEGLEKGELIARIAADTFNLLLKNAPAETLTKRMDNLVKRVNRFNETSDQKYYLPISSGIYVIDEPDLNMITIQDRANVARKENKNKGGVNRLSSCAFYTDLERLRMIREKEIDNRMETALANGEFVVYLQPKVELQNNTVAAAEALVRWRDPERGIIPPGEFIPLFEKNGFIVKLDIYVFEQVCKTLRRWMDQGLTPVPISVNLSRVHLHNPDFLKPFQRAIQKYGIPPRLLEIELTETLVFENLQALIQIIKQIHEIGFTCSLDDFGSGYSSLNILKDVPVDVIKLDRGFFAGSDKNERGRHVIESVLQLARRLDIKTVSEGVEAVPQVDFLRRAHCDMIQGYVFSKPVPVEEFERISFSGKPFLL